MIAYLIRRLLYAVPILVSVNLLTYFIFFFVNSPDDIIRTIKGDKHVSPADLHQAKRELNYHLPSFWNGRDEIIYLTTHHREPIWQDRTSLPKAKICRPQDLAKLLPINANSIIAVDPSGMTEAMAQNIGQSLLPAGVPLVILLSAEDSEPEVRKVFQSRSFSFMQTDAFADFYLSQQVSGFACFSQTIFFDKSVRLFWFDFGRSDRDKTSIGHEVLQRMGPSMTITIPAFVLGVLINIFLSMSVAAVRGSKFDRSVLVICAVLMSIVSLYYIFFCQLLIAGELRLLPISGWQGGADAWRFAALPILISVVAGLGGGIRFYRTVFLEVISQDFIRTARAKGLSEWKVLFHHALRNALLPILTSVVASIPLLYTGGLVLENFFSIPGLGSYMVDGLSAEDFRIVGAMVYLGSVMYIVGLILTDISYTLADPRVRLK